MCSASDPPRPRPPARRASSALPVLLVELVLLVPLGLLAPAGAVGGPAAATSPGAAAASGADRSSNAAGLPGNARDPARSAYPIGPIPGPDTGASSAKPSNPHANDPIAISQGRRLFVRFNCYGCHGGRGGGGMGPSLRDSTWLYGSDDADIFDSIAQGRGQGMPAWRARLNPDDIWKLVAYIKSFGSDQEPEPPR